MLSRQKLTISLALLFLMVPAVADPVVYVSNGFQFGTTDLSTGTFQQIGPGLPAEGTQGLAPGPNGSFLTLSFSGNLDSISPTTGAVTVIGPSGLSDCTTPTSPCGPTSVSTIAGLEGRIYALDLQNKLYTVNPTTGTATAIGLTGIPALPFLPLSTNPDGTINVYDEALFPAGGKLYATFDAGILNPGTSAVTSVIAANLYQIDPLTGVATVLGSTDFGLGAAAEINGQTYVFSAPLGQIFTLDLESGKTVPITDIDPTAGIITGATATPEPASVALAIFGMAGLMLFIRRARLSWNKEF